MSNITDVNNQSSGQFPTSDPITNRFFLTPEEKASKDKGKQIVKAFFSQQTSNDSLNFFRGRNVRWIEVLLWAIGSQRMQEFLDYMNVSDANKAWVNIDMTQQRLAPQFVSTLIEIMGKNKVYPCVNAIDDGSMSEKEQRLYEALFRMHEVATINDMQQQTGLQLEPTGAYVPDDEMSAVVHFKLEDRLPKEIRFEEMLASIQKAIQFDRVLNRKTIFDLTVLNCGVTKIERLAPKQYTVRKCVPTNTVWNFFMNDTGDFEITQIGEFYNLKVKDFRAKFGKSPDNPDGLTEKQIFDLARQSNNKNIGMFNYMWNDNWAYSTYNVTRPYDDSSIYVFDCEINCGEDAYWVSKKDSFGKDNIQAKNGVPYQQRKKDGTIIEQPKPDDVEIIKRQKNSWYRGVYAPYGDTMLYWGKPDIIITPYTDVAKPLSSYSINIPNNNGEYVPSLFERALEPLREYTLTKLKRKQLIAKIRPSGMRVDVESARNLDLGNGDSIAWEEVVRIYDQTGVELWSSKGVNPLENTAPPIAPGVQNRAIQDIIGLTQILAGIVLEIRELIGVSVYQDGSVVGDRTSGKLQEGQVDSGSNVFGYVMNADMQLWEETFYKLCLLHWNDVVKEEPESKDDMINTRFEVSVEMKMTDYQREILEADIQRYSQVIDANGNPALSPKDAMMLREIDNSKLARWYLATTVEQNRRKSIQDAQRAVQENAMLQQQSNEQAAQKAIQLQKDKLETDKELADFQATKQKELELLKGFFQVAAKDESGTMIKQFMPAIQQLVPNITIPLAEENKQMTQNIQAQELAQQQEMMMQQQQQMQQQIPNEQMQPQ